MNITTEDGDPQFRADRFNVSVNQTYGTIDLVLTARDGQKWVTAFDAAEINALIPDLAMGLMLVMAAGEPPYPTCAQDVCHCPGWAHGTQPGHPIEGDPCNAYTEWHNPQAGPCQCPGYQRGHVSVTTTHDPDADLLSAGPLFPDVHTDPQLEKVRAAGLLLPPDGTAIQREGID